MCYNSCWKKEGEISASGLTDKGAAKAMETLYQTVDRSGISIPLEIIRGYGLPEGTRIAISLQKDGIRVTPAEVSVAEIENRALRYLLKNVGDAVSISAPQRSAAGNWLVPVVVTATRETIGQLCYTVAGVLVPGESTPAARLLGDSDGP